MEKEYQSGDFVCVKWLGEYYFAQVLWREKNGNYFLSIPDRKIDEYDKDEPKGSIRKKPLWSNCIEMEPEYIYSITFKEVDGPRGKQFVMRPVEKETQ